MFKHLSLMSFDWNQWLPAVCTGSCSSLQTQLYVSFVFSIPTSIFASQQEKVGPTCITKCFLPGQNTLSLYFERATPPVSWVPLMKKTQFIEQQVKTRRVKWPAGKKKCDVKCKHSSEHSSLSAACVETQPDPNPNRTYLLLPVLNQLRQAKDRGDRPAADDRRPLQSLPERHGGPCGRAVNTPDRWAPALWKERGRISCWKRREGRRNAVFMSPPAQEEEKLSQKDSVVFWTIVLQSENREKAQPSPWKLIINT